MDVEIEFWEVKELVKARQLSGSGARFKFSPYWDILLQIAFNENVLLPAKTRLAQ